MTGFEKRIADVLSDVLEDVPGEKLLAAAGKLMEHGDELWIDGAERPPYAGDEVIAMGIRGGIYAGVVCDGGADKDGKFGIRFDGRIKLVRYWIPAPKRCEVPWG